MQNLSFILKELCFVLFALFHASSLASDPGLRGRTHLPWLGPLAGTVSRLLDGVGHPGGVATAEELHGALLQAHLAAALTEPRVGVDVVVVDAGRWALPIAGHNVHLEPDRVSLGAYMAQKH